MGEARKRLVGARFGAVIAAAVVFVVGLGWLVLPQQAPSTAPPQAQQTQWQADGAGQHHAQPQAQPPPHGDRDTAPQQGQTPRDTGRGKPDDTAWWTVASAVVTAASAVVQALSAAFTLAATVALVLIGRAQRDISAGQKRIGADQAEIMGGQRDIAREQTAILETQARTTQILADLERPVLFVRGVESVEFEPHPEATPSGAAQRRPLARIRFANYGRTPAVLLGIEGTVAVAGGVPPEPDYGGAAHREMRLQVVEAGEEKGVSARIEGRLVTDGEAHLAQSDQLLTIVYGRLVYRDAFGDRAATGFGYLLRGGKPLPLPFAAYNYRKTYGPEDQGAPHADYEL